MQMQEQMLMGASIGSGHSMGISMGKSGGRTQISGASNHGLQNMILGSDYSESFAFQRGVTAVDEMVN